LVIPLLATVGRVFIGGKKIAKLKPLMRNITNPKQMNIDFLKDYGKKTIEDFKFNPSEFNKQFEKVKVNPKEILQNFLKNGDPENLGSEIPSSKVGFEIPEIESEIPDIPEEQERRVPLGFKNLGGLEDLIKDGRTFGSIGLLLFVILFIVIAIRPVKNTNETRLTLAFKSLLGLTELNSIAEQDEPEDEKPKTTAGNVFSIYDKALTSRPSQVVGKVIPQIGLIQSIYALIQGAKDKVEETVEDVKNFAPDDRFKDMQVISGIGNRGYRGFGN
jgi:hypothetical protein